MDARKIFIIFIATTLTIAFSVCPAKGERISVFGEDLNVLAQISQLESFGLKEGFDTKSGINSIITTLLADLDYRPRNDLKLFSQLGFTGDWIYNALHLHDDGLWNRRDFDDSRRLYLDDKYWMILKEAHVTWTPRDFMFRVGKQIVSWGQTDVFRLMDQINPVDNRRGPGDVDFETTIIPIWLIRADYAPKIKSTWLQDLTFQFVFNPNVDFIANQPILPGNDKNGIMAPFLKIGWHRLVGSYDELNIDKPSGAEGFKFGARIQGIVADTLISLNALSGRENDFVLRRLPGLRIESVDGYNIYHFNGSATYPRQRFVGGTASRDLTFLRDVMFGISPVLRLEALYAFDTTFVNAINTLQKRNEIRWALGMDWKVELRWLNPKAGTAITAQIYERRILDYPQEPIPSNPRWLGGLKEDNWMTTLKLSTAYFNDRLTPSITGAYDITNSAWLIKPDLTYIYDNHWIFSIGGLYMGGKKETRSYEVYENKDQIYFKVVYRWG